MTETAGIETTPDDAARDEAVEAHRLYNGWDGDPDATLLEAFHAGAAFQRAQIAARRDEAAVALVQYETSGICRPGEKCQMCDCGVQNMDRAQLAEDLRRNRDRIDAVLAALGVTR